MNVEEELKTYLQVLWRYKWTIVACGVIAFATAVVISLLLTPKYKATATVRVASTPGGASDYTYIGSLTRLTNTYVEIASSDLSLNEVATRLGLPEELKVEVDVVPETELIEISTSNPDPQLAVDIANTLAIILVEQSLELYGGDVPTAREILEEQLAQAELDLENAVAEYEQALLKAQATPTMPISGTPVPNPDLETLAHIVAVRQQIYGDLLQRYETARTNEQLRTNAITLVEPASLPEKPDSPKLFLYAALGLVAGLAFGVILAFVFEGMNDTLRGVEDIQAVTPLPILGIVPKLNEKFGSKANPIVEPNGRLSSSPAFDRLRARLMLLDSQAKSTKILITSPEPGAGKSTVAANLAVSLTHGGKKVILVDMDFRRPRQHSIMGIKNDNGLLDYLRGEIRLEDTLHATALEDLRVITAGANHNDPVDWFTPPIIYNLFEELGKDCEYLIIDSPALLSVADPMVLASQADAVILVVARYQTERRNLRFALQQLAGLKAKIAGIVVNKMPNTPLYSYYSWENSEGKSRSNMESSRS